MIRILAATILFAVMGTIPAKAALSLPVFRQCLCITPAGAWTVKPRGDRHKKCAIVCNATPQKRTVSMTDISSSRKHSAHARPFRSAHVRDLGHSHRVRGAGVALVGETFDNDGRVRIVATTAQSRAGTRVVRAITRPIATVAHVATRIATGVATGSASLAGLPAELVAKVEEITQSCPGFRAISTYRPGALVAGTHIPSLHGFHKAADIAGPNYACAYARLQGWPGGVSTDSDRVAHIHLSYAPGSAEWGARFRHGGGGHHVRRYAKRRLPAWGG